MKQIPHAGMRKMIFHTWEYAWACKSVIEFARNVCDLADAHSAELKRLPSSGH